MIPAEFIEWALGGLYDITPGGMERAWRYLGEYLGKSPNTYVFWPEAQVLTKEGKPLEKCPGEPDGFREYVRRRERELLGDDVIEAWTEKQLSQTIAARNPFK